MKLAGGCQREGGWELTVLDATYMETIKLMMLTSRSLSQVSSCRNISMLTAEPGLEVFRLRVEDECNALGFRERGRGQATLITGP